MSFLVTETISEEPPFSTFTLPDRSLRASHSLEVVEDVEYYSIVGRHFRVGFNKSSGGIDHLELFNGKTWHSILAANQTVGLNSDIPVIDVRMTVKDDSEIEIMVDQQDHDWKIRTIYEFHARGYVIGTFRIETRRDGAKGKSLAVSLGLDNTVFARPHRIVNESPSAEMRQVIRGFSVNFSTDNRPVTNSVDFLLESVVLNANGRTPIRFSTKEADHQELGWKLTTGWPYPFPIDYVYENRWCLSFTAVDSAPSPVRGQRIYQWFGNIAEKFSVPSESELLEMAEYGCSILIFHLPVFTQIDIQEAKDPEAMQRCVFMAHRLGIKVLLYAQPYLVRRNPEVAPQFLQQRTECLNVWNALLESQVVSYLPDFSENDCDELNLRHSEAFDHIRDSAVNCLKKYQMDGLYIDFAWPAQGLAVNPENNQPGLFNFYDYLRLLREWRKAVGPEGIMIGHGGGFLVGSDMVEAFDACLTGEAQRIMTPEALGVQYGTAPSLWIIQRNKRDIFRSPQTIENLIREGVSPHVGLGVCGKAIIATVDGGYFPELMALWQMWRAFPMEKARFYNYLSETVVSLDNTEIVYSLYTTDKGETLLLLANCGGPRLDDSPSIGVNVLLNLEALKLPNTLRCWRMKGNTYETFRIAEIDPIENGVLSIYEIDHHEFQGYIFSPDEPPETLIRLQKHFEGMPKRLSSLLEKKQSRLKKLDQQLDAFAKEPHAHVFFSYEKFMAGRVAE